MTLTEHYERAHTVYRELGEIDGPEDSWHTIGNADFMGWYRTRDGPGEWDGEGRPWALSADWPELRRSVDRVVYATVNYAPSEWFMDAWKPFRYGENGKEWAGETPTPGYGDLRAYAPFADIDLIDDVKTRRPEGDIPRDAIESALADYIEAFAELGGGREHVFALDSVGGAYVMVAPTATTPIAEAFAREDRTRLFDDLTDRMNIWLDDVRKDVNGRNPEISDTFEPDLLNNKNRLYKAPMSVHSSLDGVVTPIDPERPRYEFTPLEETDDTLVKAAWAWSSRFTADHRDAVAAVVAGLWPDYHAEADGWQEALRDRLVDLRADEIRNRERQARIPDPDELPDDLEATDDLDVITAKINAIDVRDVARDVADKWDTAPGRDPPRFAAPWNAPHDSGTASFAWRDGFYDNGDGTSGDALKLVARARGIISEVGDDLRGHDYWRAVNELRQLGYDIPYFSGRSGTHPDGLRLFEDTDDDMSKVLRAVAAEEQS